MFGRRVTPPTLLATKKAADPLSFSGTGPDSKTPRLERAVVGDIAVEGYLNVTGTITAPLTTAITDLYLGEEQDRLVSAKTTDLVDVLDLLNPGKSDPEYVNIGTNPTTAVNQTFSLLMRGPFALHRFQSPVLGVEIDPSKFGSGISAFTLSARVTMRPYAGGLVKRLYRAYKGSATTHTFSLGKGEVHGVLMVTGAGTMNECHLVDEGNNPLEDLGTAQACTGKLGQNWADYKNIAPVVSPTRYFSRGYTSRPYPGRIMQVELASAQTLTTWALGPG